MSESVAKPRRRRSVVTRSHEDIYKLVEKALEQAEHARTSATDAVSRSDLAHLVGQRIEGKVDGLVKTIGSQDEDERGERVGTGVIGRLMRLETTVARRFSLYDGWAKLVIGFTAAAVIAGPIIWWLVSGRLSPILQ